jgi:hypothetical protein
MSFVGSEDYIRAQFEDYLLALLSSVKYYNYLQQHTQQSPHDPQLLPEIGPPPPPPLSHQLTFAEGNPARDFGTAWIETWRLTNNYAIWMSLTDAELFDIIEPRHPCAGTTTLSLEDMQFRVTQKMADLKIDEKMVASKEVLSRTWVQGSTKVRAGLGSAWANLDQYRQSQRKPSHPPTDTEGGSDGKTESKDGEVEGENGTGGGTGKKETFVGGWAAWAAEKRKRAFQKEEVGRVERIDIGPAPARPLAMWAAQRKRSSESGVSGEGKGGGGESVRSSVTGESVKTSSDTQIETVKKEAEDG